MKLLWVEKIFETVLDYNDGEVAELVGTKLFAVTDPQTIFDYGLIAAPNTLGVQFSTATLFGSEMLIVANVGTSGFDTLGQ